MTWNRKIKKIINHLGIKLEERDLKRNYVWDGKTLSISGLDYGGIFHEIAHWMIASPERRKIPEYGLGPSPYIQWGYKRNISNKLRKLTDMSYASIYDIGFDTKASHKEEMLVSVFGIALQASIGMSYIGELVEQNWYNPTYLSWGIGEYPTPYLFDLKKQGLLIKHNPKILLDLNLVPLDLIGAPLLTLKYINRKYRNERRQ